MTVLALVLMAVAFAGCLYTIGAIHAVRVFARPQVRPSASTMPGVTVLKPLHGAEHGLYENLVSFLEQDGVDAVQFVFGVAGEHDLAIPVVRRLVREFPRHDIELVVSHRPANGNGKIANLAAMSAAVKHGVIVMSDSDIRVTPSYLRDVCETLAHSDVGLVTCLYRGGVGGSLWSRLSTMAIDFHFFPSVLVGVRLDKARPCMGATIALSVETLNRIGGFQAFASHLADDYAIGEAVRATGLRVVVAKQVVVHQCNEQSAADVFLHELRWARTIRSIDPVGYAGSLITHPLPFALMALLTGAFPLATLSCVVATIVLRICLQRQVEAAMGVATHRWLLGPMRDLLAFAVYLTSFATDSVVWRGERFRVGADGTMIRIDRRRARNLAEDTVTAHASMDDDRAAARRSA